MSVSASRLTLGTMRFSADRHTVEQWARFLIEAHDIGIRSLHVSNEYESWPLFLESLAIARKASSDIDFRFIAKLGEPHFDHPSFDAKRLEQHVERYRLKLGIERLEDIQWMWRADLDQDGKRCADFVGQADSIRTCIERLKRNGQIGRFLCFPYSPSFATQALDFEFFDGLAVYRNAQERDYETHLDQCQMKSKIAHIIRPFRAGATLTDQNLNPQQQLIQALDHPAVETAILSTGNMAHLHDLLI